MAYTAVLASGLISDSLLAFFISSSKFRSSTTWKRLSFNILIIYFSNLENSSWDLGAGYEDIRDFDGDWIRIHITQGTLIVLPKGMYHRFTLDDTNYLKVQVSSILELIIIFAYNYPNQGCNSGPVTFYPLLCAGSAALPGDSISHSVWSLPSLDRHHGSQVKE